MHICGLIFEYSKLTRVFFFYKYDHLIEDSSRNSPKQIRQRVKVNVATGDENSRIFAVRESNV